MRRGARQRRGASSSARSTPLAQRLPRHGPVHRASVDVAVAQPPRDFSRDGPLSGARRAVNGNDQIALVDGGRGSEVAVTLLLSSGMRWRRRAASAAIARSRVFALVVSGAGYVGAAHDYVRGAAFVVRAAGMHGIARTRRRMGNAAGYRSSRSRFPGGPARFRPASICPVAQRRRTFLLVPGVHASGVDEPRLVGFARDLASMGHPVVTVGPPDLARYTISPQSTDAIEDAAAVALAAARLSPRRPHRHDGDQLCRRACRSSPPGVPLSATVSPPCCRSAATATCRERCAISARASSRTANRRPPHDYGVVIILLGVADRVVPAEQVPTLREAILTFLEASRLDLVDKAQSAAEFERAKALGGCAPRAGADADELRERNVTSRTLDRSCCRT